MEIEKIDIKAVIHDALLAKVGQAINYQELHSMIGNVINERQDEFTKVMNECLDTVFKDKKFKEVIIEEFRHKVAKNLVAKLEGAIEKNVLKFRQDPVMNSKMILAIEGIINNTK